MDPDQTPGLAPVCLRCGRCCRYGPSINANISDLKRWITEHRSEILKFFEAYCTDGTYVNCARFSPAELSSRILWTDMINPDTGDYYQDCPFLQPLSENTWYCSIYETRPAICIRFRPWEWGEKGVFFSCPVVEQVQDRPLHQRSDTPPDPEK
jgi:Fe-S-cluster containining protein